MRHQVLIVILLSFLGCTQEKNWDEMCVRAIATADKDSVDLAATTTLLRVFGPACEDNPKIIAWGNEVLFEVLRMDPALVIEAMKDDGVKIPAVLDELRSPVLKYDYDELHVQIAMLPQSNIRDSVLAALEYAVSLKG